MDKKSLRTIFDEAAEISDPAARAQFVTRATDGDTELSRRVTALLSAHEKAGGFLKGSEEQDGSVPRLNTPDGHAGIHTPHERVSRYKLLQKLGEGGCGVVYLAEQQEPVKRRVALKVIKLGMDTRSVIARFEAERQALALMDHPYIARVLDAGATEAGRPYFVMELVRGVRITDYCDQHNLSTTERLKLFMQVCHAIQHAHQKGIIHRDIKPSNILVTSHDGAPVPKVIDFGIAKATTDLQLTDKTLFTQFELLIGTPAYMSPEQAGINGLDIDTRSDIYALGVLLYELLTGRTPFDTQTLLKSGLDAMRRTIRETEPTRPSTRLRALAAPDLSEVARQRRAEPLKLISLVRGDLDWIVLKALEKDRTRRYETAGALAAELQRYLQDEPVIARPPSRLYLLQKLVQRNKAGVAAAIAVTLALVAGLTLSTLAFFKERQARQRADAAETTQRQLREEAVAARVQADTANQRLKHDLFVREWREAENLMVQGKTAAALAWFARSARARPDDPAVVNRLVSALNDYNFALPLHQPFLHGAAVNSAVFSGDGRRLITAANDGLVRVWPVFDPGEPLVLSNRFAAPLAAFVPREDRLLVVENNSVSLWDLNGARIRHRAVRHPSRPRLFMTPDGRFAALGCGEGGPQLWDAAELRPVGRPAEGVDESFRMIGVSPDARYVFGKHSDTFVSAWEVSSGRRVWQAPPPRSTWKFPVESLLVHPDGDRVALGQRYGHFTVWRFNPATNGLNAAVEPAELGHRFQLPSTSLSAMVFAGSKERLLLAASENVVQLDALGGTEVTPVFIEHEGRITSLQLSPDGQRLATASVDGTARIWDVRMNQPRPSLFTNGPAVWDVKFSPDGTWFAMGGMPALELRDGLTGALRHRMEMSHVISRLDISSDGRRVVAASEAGEACVWDAATGRRVTPVLRFPHNVQHVEFTRDGRWFVAGAPREVVWVYETETGALAVPPMTNDARVVGAHFSPDGRSLAVATIEGRIVLWSLPEGRRRGEPLRHKDLIWTTRFSPDGRLLLTASGDRTAMLWDADTGRAIREFRHDKPVYHVAFSPDGRLILTGSSANEARVWEAATGRQLFSPLRHPGGVWYGEFSADGRILVTGDDAGYARLWDAASGLPIGGWMRNGSSLKRLQLSHDLRRLVAAGDDGAVRLWTVALAPTPAPAWLPELAEAVAGRRLKDDGSTELLPPERWQALGAELAARTGDDYYTRWAGWFRTERMKKHPAAFER